MPKKILVVDDDQDIVFMLKSVLEKDGFEVTTASDGNQALNLIKTLVPDLMIVDLTMPVMSGWRFTSKVRQNERYTKTPIIVLSGLIEHEKEPQQFETADAYIPKPFDIFKLVEKVKELLAR